MDKNVLFYKRTEENEEGLGCIIAPHYPGDAGYDLVISETVVLEPGKLTNVPCGIQIALPEGYSALVIPRSSIVKSSIMVFQTLIDNGWRGPIFAIAQNMNSHPVTVKAGERIAQLLPVRVTNFDVVEVEELVPSERGTNGFGSTGS